ncbi:hypothetical protein N3K66_005371 [Trichothecium roseum]|uniref:Uncharacterized protein n=1 Tax=Trichothecium roseum TaxID=47278 RepID=A0ACC0V0B5_9HYPO|nr:hypothetical protein N3K66_005371 [Trichothecium roseum]
MHATQPRATSIDATMTCPSSLQSKYSAGQTTLEAVKKNTGVVAGVVSQSSVVVNPASDPQRHPEYRSKVLQWLCPQHISSALKTPAEGQGAQNAHKNAGQRFIKSPKFREWESGNKKRLWGTGPPGAGKTFLVSRVHNHLKPRQTVPDGPEKTKIAVLYMHHNETYTVQNLLACISRQFTEASLQIPPNIYKLWSEKGGSDLSIEENRSLIKQLAADEGKSYLVVDAWDECQLHVREQFLRELKSLDEDVSVFITSRLTQDTETSDASVCHLNVSANETDIQDYISFCIEHDARLKEFCDTDKALESDIKQKLLQESGNNESGRIFLLVKLHMDSLKNEVLLDGVRIKLATLHHDLDDKYLGIINRIDDQDSTRRNIAIDALIWIAHALRPLRTLELQHALAMTVEDLRFKPGRMPRQQDITAFSCGMVVHENSTKTFRLVHNTAKKFIRGLSESDSRFKDPHVKISLVIGSYLCMPKLEQPDDPIQRTSSDTGASAPLSQYNDQDVHEIQSHGGESQDQDVYSYRTKMQDFPLANPSESPTSKVVQFVEVPDADGDVNPTQSQRSLARANAEASLPPKKREERDYLKLVVAALQGDCDKINSLVEEKKVVLCIPHAGKYSRTCEMIVNLALFLAIEHNKMEVIRTLIMAGVPIGSRDFDERTPLHRAAAKNDKKLVEFLLENDANLEARDVRGDTPWVIAAREMHDDICQLLVKSGANVNSTGICGLNLLYEAAAGGHTKHVASLLRQGVNPSITTDFGWAPLHWAAGNGHMACVRLLLDCHADVNILSDTHESPLDMALRGTHTEIANILKDKGALSGGDIFMRYAGYLYDTFADIRSSEEESADEENSDEEGLDGRISE